MVEYACDPMSFFSKKKREKLIYDVKIIENC